MKKEIKNTLRVTNAAMLIFTTHAWGNRKKVDTKNIEAKAEKSFLSVSKKLIDSQEYKDILNYQTEVYDWINRNSVPSFYLRGSYLFSMNFVDEVEEYIKSAQETLKKMIEPLILEYQKKMDDAQERLGDLWNPNDYPSIQKLEGSFSFEKRWVKFDIPEELPSAIFKEEQIKAENMWKESAEQISLCLRQAFVELIKHANEVLQPDANGKTKGFKNSSFDKIDEFIATFKNRNIVNDKDLEELVQKANNILKTVDDPQELKKDAEMRNIVSNNFKEITDKLNTMIETKPSRKFDLE